MQASAHRDIEISLRRIKDKEQIVNYVPQEVDIFDYCVEWTTQHAERIGLLGVVIETIRTILAEWIDASALELRWEPEVPKNCFEFDLGETNAFFEAQFIGFKLQERRVIWVCQRELQRKVAQMWTKEENLPENAALIMLFILGFPGLHMEKVQDVEIIAQEYHEEAVEEITLNRDSRVDVNAQSWHAWTALAPQDISLMFRVDLKKLTVSLRLRNNSDNGRFILQDWVHAGMESMMGFEGIFDGDFGYNRQIVRADLRQPIVELCPLRWSKDGIQDVVKKTRTARVWHGWPVFDVRIAKFEMGQWLAACDVQMKRDMNGLERGKAEVEVAKAELQIGIIILGENKDVDGSMQDSKV